MITASVNAKALSKYMCHVSVTITYDRYGHIMPGNEDEAECFSMPTSNGRILRLAWRSSRGPKRPGRDRFLASLRVAS
jgi:hypothetical protein